MPKNTFSRLPQERRRQILSAARAEFAAHMFRDSSINRVMAAAGISPGSFYQYFSDKRDMYLCVLDDCLDEYLKVLEKAGISPARFFYEKALTGMTLPGYDEYVAPETAEIIKNFANGPTEIHRDWVLDCVLKRMVGLDPVAEGIVDAGEINPRYIEFLPLFLYISVGVSPVINQYAGGDPARTLELANLFREVLVRGLRA